MTIAAEVLVVKCWRCRRRLLDLDVGGSGWTTMKCRRCRKLSRVDLSTGATSPG